MSDAGWMCENPVWLDVRPSSLCKLLKSNHVSAVWLWAMLSQSAKLIPSHYLGHSYYYHWVPCKTTSFSSDVLNKFSLVLGPVCPSTSSTPWGAYNPCCHHSTGNYSKTQAINVKPGTHSLLGQESAHTGKGPCPMTQCHITAQDPHPGPLDPKSRAVITAPWCPACLECTS